MSVPTSPATSTRWHNSSMSPIQKDARTTGRCAGYAWATINHPPAPPHLHWCGHVRDVVAKVDGQWLIAEKDIMGWAGKVLERFREASTPCALSLPTAH